MNKYLLLADKRTKKECKQKNIAITNKYGYFYTKKAQKIFDKHFNKITSK